MVVGLLAEGSGGAKALQALGVRLEEVRVLPKRILTEEPQDSIRQDPTRTYTSPSWSVGEEGA